MAILINKDTKVIVQGITGKAARFHTEQMRKFGTNIVAGVSPGKAGQLVQGIPVFNTVRDAVIATGADASIIFVPAPSAADSIMEAVEAEVPLVVCITEHIPLEDMVVVHRYMVGRKTRLIGPNCPGLLMTDQCNIGIIPGEIFRKGHVGVVSRSGTLTYEATFQLTNAGIGQTGAIGIGGDPIKDTDFIDALKLYNEDPDTDAVLMIGEIGGNAEEEAAKWIHENMKKPVAGFIAGRMAPLGKRMGHAGAIISGGKGTAAEKIAALEAVGIPVAPTVAHIGRTVIELLKKNGLYEKCHTC
ncbi:succinate--CoA ligase subunit alpha [uncultured Dialister sp.]|jgi:succinyl-CoA synthetase alpha subunit|uniref:succinate--CoA ligase subunit alpha n=1 Tax=uncultured Dialister sp. TaxID=278064 RepID=UPI002671967E|nr:succinate--CoA ligase subunit alpha [uncultured Dialister sp.]